MTVAAVNSSSAAATATATSAAPVTASNFADFLQPLPIQDAEVKSGRISVHVDAQGKPGLVSYYDANGALLTKGGFSADQILSRTEQFGIPVSDLNGLADQLDAGHVKYKPGQLYAGSDAGIDLRDLASGGLGTSFDWRVDFNVGLKGPYALAQLAADRALAARVGAVAHPAVTTQFAAQQAAALASTATTPTTTPAPTTTTTTTTTRSGATAVDAGVSNAPVTVAATAAAEVAAPVAEAAPAAPASEAATSDVAATTWTPAPDALEGAFAALQRSLLAGLAQQNAGAAATRRFNGYA